MLANAALRIEAHFCDSTDAVFGIRSPPSHSKVELPLQKSLLTLNQSLCDHEPWLLQRIKHVIEDSSYGSQAMYVVEWILEVRICCVIGIELLKICWG